MIFILVEIAGILIGKVLAVKHMMRRGGISARQIEEKLKNKVKILEELYFRRNEDQEAKITNDEGPGNTRCFRCYNHKVSART